MFSLFKNESNTDNKVSIISIACLLIHAAKIDENYSEKERKIIRDSLIKLGAETKEIDEIIKKAEENEKNANQIIEYTKEAKNLSNDQKILLIEALWEIIYSDKNADMYETNLIRRLCGLLYLDKKVVGDIKEKIKNKKL
tara:strand:+ start:1218 stop:1637 length:420 start_codon:yes stop_codon:yes gene_type:complete